METPRLAGTGRGYLKIKYCLFLLNTPQQTYFSNGRGSQSLPFLFLQILTKSLASTAFHPFPSTSPVPLL